MVKLKKYAYNTLEMLFNKVKDWPRHVDFKLSLFFSEVWDTFKRSWFMYICIVLYSLSGTMVGETEPTCCDGEHQQIQNF
jgi:hypothetical protein